MEQKIKCNTVDEAFLKRKNPYISKQPLGEEYSFVRIDTEATSATRSSFELENESKSRLFRDI
jgi:hypothetical protein